MADKIAERFTTLDKNLLNYPLARSRLTRSWCWQREDDGWIVGKPPRDTGFEFQLPPGTRHKYWRCPTGFEINMLMELSAKAQALDTDTIEFASIPQLLGLMGVSENSHYCERTREALTYWSRVEVRYLKWYLGRGRYRLNKMITPIEVIKYDGTRIKITLAPEYARPAKRYFKRIHLPLPSNETAQNITLCMLAWKWTASNGRDRMRTGPRLRLFMRKVGLGSHKNNASRYDAVVQRVVKPWFEKVYGWGFKHLIVEDRKVFVWLNRSRVEREAHHDADDAKMKREG